MPLIVFLWVAFGALFRLTGRAAVGTTFVQVGLEPRSPYGAHAFWRLRLQSFSGEIFGW